MLSQDRIDRLIGTHNKCKTFVPRTLLVALDRDRIHQLGLLRQETQHFRFRLVINARNAASITGANSHATIATRIAVTENFCLSLNLCFLISPLIRKYYFLFKLKLPLTVTIFVAPGSGSRTLSSPLLNVIVGTSSSLVMVTFASWTSPSIAG